MPKIIQARIRQIKAALAGKSGYQCPWAIATLREELAALLAAYKR